MLSHKHMNEQNDVLDSRADILYPGELVWEIHSFCCDRLSGCCENRFHQSFLLVGGLSHWQGFNLPPLSMARYIHNTLGKSTLMHSHPKLTQAEGAARKQVWSGSVRIVIYADDDICSTNSPIPWAVCQQGMLRFHPLLIHNINVMWQAPDVIIRPWGLDEFDICCVYNHDNCRLSIGRNE